MSPLSYLEMFFLPLVTNGCKLYSVRVEQRCRQVNSCTHPRVWSHRSSLRPGRAHGGEDRQGHGDIRVDSAVGRQQVRHQIRREVVQSVPARQGGTPRGRRGGTSTHNAHTTVEAATFARLSHPAARQMTCDRTCTCIIPRLSVFLIKRLGTSERAERSGAERTNERTPERSGAERTTETLSRGGDRHRQRQGHRGGLHGGDGGAGAQLHGSQRVMGREISNFIHARASHCKAHCKKTCKQHV